MKLSKKSNLLIISIFCIIILLLFLPDFEKEEATVNEGEIIEPLPPEYEDMFAYIQEELTVSKAAANHYIEFLPYYLEQLNGIQLKQFIESLMTYEIKVNNYNFNTIDESIIDSETFTFSIKQVISPYVHELDNKEVKKIVKEFLKDDSFKEIEIVTEHSLKTKTIKEDSFTEYVLSGETNKLKQINNKIIFEIPEMLKEKLRLSIPIINIDLSNITTLDTDPFVNHPTFIEYAHFMNHIYMLQEALYLSITTFEDKESIISYLEETTNYSLHLTDGSQYTDKINATMNVSSRPNFTLAVENPLFLAIPEDILNEFYQKTNETYYLSSDSHLHMKDTKIVDYSPHFTISNRFSIDTSHFPATIQLSNALQQLVGSSHITLNYQSLESDDLNLYGPEIQTYLDGITDYEEQDITVGVINLRENERALLEGKKLFDYFYSFSSEEKKEGMLQNLYTQSLLINGNTYNELNSKLPLDYWGFHFLHEQRFSELLLENKSYYDALANRLLSSKDFAQITLHSNHPIYKTEILQSNKSTLKFSTKDTVSLVNDEKIQLKLSETLKNHYQLVSSNIQLHPSIDNYYGNPFQMGSLNSRLKQSIVMMDGLYMQTEVEFIKAALAEVITKDNEQQITEYIHDFSKIKKLTLESDDELHDLTQGELTVNRGIRFSLYIDNPLFTILPWEMVNKYLQDYFLASNFIQLDKQPINLSHRTTLESNYGASRQDSYLNESDIPLTVTFSDYLVETLDLDHKEIILHLK